MMERASKWALLRVLCIDYAMLIACTCLPVLVLVQVLVLFSILLLLDDEDDVCLCSSFFLGVSSSFKTCSALRTWSLEHAKKG